MKKVKVLLASCCALILSMGFTACSPKVSTTPTNDSNVKTEVKGDRNGDGKVVIGFNNLQETEEFFKVVKASLEKAVKAKGWEMLYSFSERDPEKMRSTVDSFILQKADFIIDFNVLPEAGSAIAADLKAKNIPMLSIDCLYDDAYFFGVNNQMAGETAGDFLAEKIKEKWGGKPDYIFHIYSEVAGADVKKRNSGAGDALKKAFPDFDPKNEIWQNVGDDPTEARSAMVNFLTAHPDAHRIAVVSVTDNRAYTALSGIESVNRINDVLMVSHNADDTAVQHLKTTPDDSWVGTVKYNSELYGDKIVQVVEKILNGEKVDIMNYNELTTVDRKNVKELFPN